MIAELDGILSFSIFALGAIIGSFLNVCIVRLPHERSVVFPASHCIHCKKPIAWFDNIPLLSWLLLGGRCRQCKKKISLRYFLVELITAVGFLIFYKYYGFHIILVPYLVMFGGFIVATFVDFEHRIIPDEISVGGTVAGVVFSLLIPQLHGQDIFWKAGLWSLVGILAGAGPIYLMGILGNLIMPRSKRKIDNMLKEEFHQVMSPIAPDVFEGLWDDLAKNGYIVKKGESADVLQTFWDLKNAGELKLSPEYEKLNKKVFKVLLSDTMGMGDVKLMAMVGAFIGWQFALLSFFLAPFFGASFGMVEKFRKGKSSIQPTSIIKLFKYVYEKFDTGDSFIAYGPFLVLGALISLFKGEMIIRWVCGVYGMTY